MRRCGRGGGKVGTHFTEEEASTTYQKEKRGKSAIETTSPPSVFPWVAEGRRGGLAGRRGVSRRERRAAGDARGKDQHQHQLGG